MPNSTKAEMVKNSNPNNQKYVLEYTIVRRFYASHEIVNNGLNGKIIYIYIYIYTHIYRKLWRTSRLFKTKKISTKPKVDLYGGAKIQTFTTVCPTSGTNDIKPLTVTSAD